MVKEVFQRLETQTGQKLPKLRTDRSGEYFNTELDNFYKSKGAVHQTTAPYTPEQNGAAERFSRAVMEKVGESRRKCFRMPSYRGSCGQKDNCVKPTMNSATFVTRHKSGSRPIIVLNLKESKVE